MTPTTAWLAQTLNNGDENFLAQAGLTSPIIKQDVKANDKIIPGIKALMRLDDSTFYRTVPDDFEVLQPNEFLELTEKVGGLVHSAGQTEDGEIVYFTTIPEEQYQTFQVNNDIYQNYILFALSYNADIGIAIIPISINVTKNLTFNVAEMINAKKPRIRQSKNVKSRAKDIDEFKQVYLECLIQINQFKGALRLAANTNGYDLTDTLENLLPTDTSSMNKNTRNKALQAEIEDNHTALYGTSIYSIFTAIYTTDIAKHDKRRITLARRFFSGKTSPLAVKVFKMLKVA